MWLFTEDGFTSVVAYNVKKDFNKAGKHYKFVSALPEAEQSHWLLVRGRVKADLERIQSVTGLDLHIDTDGSADYAYRALMTKADFAKYMSDAIENIDYGAHFKEVVRDRAPEAGGRYEAMLKMWGSLAAIQDLTPYGTKTYKTSSAWGSYTGGSNVSGGFVWDKRKKPAYTEEVVLSDTYVSVEEMRQVLLKSGPAQVEQATIDNADDDAFSLWLCAMDTVTDDTKALTLEELGSIEKELAFAQTLVEKED